MRELKRRVMASAAVLMVFLMLVSAGCKPSTPPNGSDVPQTTNTGAAAKTTPAKTDDRTPTTPTQSEGNPPEKETVAVKDMSGREIELPTPKNLKKVYYPSPLAQVMIYTINPDLMAGLVFEPRPNQIKYLPKIKGMKVFGNFDGGKAVNVEEVLASGAQAFISMGPMEINENTRERADELQRKLGIPVIVVNGRFPERAAAYRFLGKIFGEEERCEKLADYCEKTLKDVEEKVKTIPEDKRVTLYYAEKPNGLATEPETSSHAAVFKYAGAINVADVELKGGSGMTPVNLEQIIKWNPEVIFMCKGKNSPYREITTNPNWANIKAVKEGRVYEAPGAPFSWIDRPPSSQQYLGVRYVANVLYPDVFPYDMAKEVRDFFGLFYQVDISEAEANELMGK